MRSGYSTGFVSSLDMERGMVRVTYPTRNNVVSDWLPLLFCEYNPPMPGAYVAVIEDEYGGGVCLGKIFSNSQPPQTNHGYMKTIENTAITANKDDFEIKFKYGYIKYSDGILKISAAKVEIDNYDGRCTHT